MRLIDADALTDTFKRALKHRELYADWELYSTIDNAPTIDAEPVVHCKDCFYLDEDEFENGDVVLFCNFMRAELNDMEMDGESYCSNGERREP